MTEDLIATPGPVTSGAICRYLANAYTEADGYATLFEVSDGTGTSARRRADALILNLWPSRGMELVGYEIKVSRADWLHEMKQPEKAWPVMQYCDRWSLIAAPHVTMASEIPLNWGFIEFDGKKARVIKPAPPLEARPITRTFLGAMVRKPVRDVEAMVKAAAQKHAEELNKAFDKRVQQQISYRTTEAEKVTTRAKEIFEATGIDLLNGFESVANIASAIKLAMTVNPMHTWKGLPSAISHVKSALKSLESLEQAMKGEPE